MAKPEVFRSLTFGHSPAADITLKRDEYMSGIHCRIVQHASGNFTVEDCGSTNGTWVIARGGTKVKVCGSIALLPGDRVLIGRTILPWTVDAFYGEG